jgi:fatty-acyl-CoA synthase
VGGRLTVLTGEGSESIEWSEAFSRADHVSRCMHSLGIGPGCTVMTAARTSLDHVLAIIGTWLAGAAVAVSAVPIHPRRSEALRRRFERLSDSINPSLILGDADHLKTLLGERGHRAKLLSEWLPGCASARPRHAIESTWAGTGEDIAVAQATSGTTGFPKIALVPFRCLYANIRSITDAIEADPHRDVALSWLPLSHDMGLIGLFGVSMFTGADLFIADPSLFAANPANWMRWCSVYRATVTGGPSFAYGIAAASMARRSSLDLSQLRLTMNGAEPVDVETCRLFADAGATHGLQPESMLAVYGMAEATLAVTFPALKEGLRADEVDRECLSRGQAVQSDSEKPQTSRRLARLGRPVNGMELRIRSETESTLGERQIGHVEIRGSSVIPGYLDQPFSDGAWFRTGDLGYVAEGDLVVCGRDKDLIVIAGRNIYPEEVERALQSVAGVWRGNVAVFATSRNGREAIVIMAEAEDPAHQSLARRLVTVGADWCDANIASVELIDPGSIPKTPSGKVSRSGCRAKFEAR